MNRARFAILTAVILFGVVLVGTSGFGLWGKRETQLLLYGNVDIREVDMAFRLAGRIDQVAVEEGQRVAKGDLLASVDPSQGQDRLRQADADIAQASAELAKLRKGNRPQEIAQAQARVSAAQAELTKAQADFARRQSLVEDGAISRDLWSQTVTQLRRAEAQLAEVRQAASLIRVGARAEDIAAAEARLQAARAQRSSIGTDLADTRLEAPIDGTVAIRAIEPGSLVQPGATAFTITIDRPLRVRAYLGEPDLWRISPGMKVEVRADGNPKVYHGTIGYISPRAEFTPKTVQTEDLRTDLVYRLRIIVTDPDEALRQGQPVTVSIPEARAAKEN